MLKQQQNAIEHSGVSGSFNISDCNITCTNCSFEETPADESNLDAVPPAEGASDSGATTTKAISALQAALVVVVLVVFF
jgi:hypothetical protein